MSKSTELSDEKKALIKVLYGHGIRLQHRAGEILTDLGWEVTYEVAYRDDAEGLKIRNMDIRATRCFGSITAVIIAECKYFTSPAIIFHDRNVANVSPINGFITSGGDDLTARISRGQDHHWMKDKPHQLHVSAQDKDPLLEAIRQCLKPAISASYSSVSTIYYPMVIFDGANIYKADTDLLTRDEIEAENLHSIVEREMMQVSYFEDKVVKVPKTYNIDLVRESKLENFILKTVNSELTSHASAIKMEVEMRQHRQQEHDANETRRHESI